MCILGRDVAWLMRDENTNAVWVVNFAKIVSNQLVWLVNLVKVESNKVVWLVSLTKMGSNQMI